MSRAPLLVALAVLLAGLLAGAWLARPRAPDPPLVGTGTRDPRGDARLEDLARQLEVERAVREEMREEIEGLRAQLDALVSALDDAREAEGEEGSAPPPARIVAQAGFGKVDAAALAAAGFGSSEIERLRQRLDALELDRLYLRDRATREGWLRSGRFARENTALREQTQGLREEFGDELYDWMLYTSGRPNRTEIVQVLDGSPAAEAGVRDGDRVLAYDDRRVFTPTELSRATASGRSGVLTPLDFERGRARVRLYVPRGPLGVRLRATRAEPEPVR
jgi:hypothetical protein